MSKFIYPSQFKLNQHTSGLLYKILLFEKDMNDWYKTVDNVKMTKW